jgi:hypothetical protein
VGAVPFASRLALTGSRSGLGRGSALPRGAVRVTGLEADPCRSARARRNAEGAG